MAVLPPTPDLIRRAIDYRVRCELRVLAEVLSDPSRTVPQARRWGGSAALFEHPDHRLIWCACDIAHAHGLADDELTWLARRALIADGYWDDSAIEKSRGMRWSLASLVALCMEVPKRWDSIELSESVRDVVSELRRVSGLIRDFRRSDDAGRRALALAGDPCFPAPYEMNNPTTRHSVRRRTASVA